MLTISLDNTGDAMMNAILKSRSLEMKDVNRRKIVRLLIEEEAERLKEQAKAETIEEIGGFTVTQKEAEEMAAKIVTADESVHAEPFVPEPVLAQVQIDLSRQTELTERLCLQAEHLTGAVKQYGRILPADVNEMKKILKALRQAQADIQKQVVSTVEQVSQQLEQLTGRIQTLPEDGGQNERSD